MGEEPVYYYPIPGHGMRLVDAVGRAFWTGLAGSAAFNALRGGGLRAVAANAPRAAGSLAAYYAVASAVDSAAAAARRKDDHWNGIAAGAAAWAALGARRGAVGAATLALFWGVEIAECHFPEWWMKDPEEDASPPGQQRTRPVPGGVDEFWVWGILHRPPVHIEVKEVPAAGLGL